MAEEITMDQARTMARRAGLNLSDEQLAALLPGINRARRQTAELRDLLPESAEPAGVFSAGSGRRE